MFRGVYGNFQEALRSAPKTKKLGFNHEEFITLYQDRLQRVYSEDYPVLFWLRPILQQGCRVFDLGGHRGHHFYSYGRYIEYPEDLLWTVCEVPAVVKAGDGATIFLAAGSLHYIEAPPLSEALAGLRVMPNHLILNKVPVYGGKSYVTLQNGRIAFHPLHVYNRDEFVNSIEKLGYQLIDEWPVPTRHGRIPFHPEASFPAYSGLYFQLRSR